jgi:hypothetical protein
MWAVWWAVAIGLFAIFEAFALRHPDRQWSMSRTMAYVGKQWPLSGVLLGMLFGALLVHFYWHFCPFGADHG